MHYNVPLPSCRTNDSNVQIKTNGSFFNKVNWILGNIIQSMIQIIIYLNLKKVSIPYLKNENERRMYTSQKTDVKTKGFIPRILLVEIT